MNILGLDLETTGLDINSDGIIEIGAVIWDVSNNSFPKVYSELVKDEKAKIFNSEIKNPYEKCEKVSGITQRMVEEYGLGYCVISDEIVEMFESCDFILASNGINFDKPMLKNFMNRCETPLPERTWIDLIYDFDFPEDCRHRDLMYLAAYHGFLNPFPHRAVFDVTTMIKIAKNYDMKKVVEIAKSPFVKIIAKVSFKQKEKAKENGFYWDGEKKIWYMDIKEKRLDYDWLAGLPFEVDVLDK